MKGEKNCNENNELNEAKAFINKYNEMKLYEPNTNDNCFINKINHSTTTLIKKNKISEENYNKTSTNEAPKIKINKIYIGIDELKSDNNIKINNNTINNKKD